MYYSDGFFTILRMLIWPVIIIGLIVLFVSRRKEKSLTPNHDKDWYLRIALSKEDAVSQLLLLLSAFFLGITLMAFNRDFEDPLSWRSITLLTASFTLIGAYYFKIVSLLVFGLIGMTSWWGIQAAKWLQGKDIKSAAIFSGLSMVALLFYVLGRLHERQERFKRFAMVYLVLGIVWMTGVLFFLSTKPGLKAFEAMLVGATPFKSWPIMVSLSLFNLAVLGAVIYALPQKLLSIFESGAVVFLLLLFGVMIMLSPQKLFVEAGTPQTIFTVPDLSSQGVLWAIFFNVIIFLELLGLIFSGYKRQEGWLINLGAVFLFLFIFSKYFDWFFTFLDKSIFFIVAGILLFGVGWFMERGRRYMISSIKKEAKQIS